MAEEIYWKFMCVYGDNVLCEIVCIIIDKMKLRAYFKTTNLQIVLLMIKKISHFDIFTNWSNKDS